MNHDLIYFPEHFPGEAEPVTVEKGEKIVSSGSWPHYVYVVKKGTASVRYVSGKGKYIEASEFLKGDFIGEMNAICSQPFIFDAVAKSRMELLRIPAGQFIRAMQSDFRLVQSMVQSQNNRINWLEAYCIITNTFSVYEKVLLYLCCRFVEDKEVGAYNKETLTAILGCDLRSLNRALAVMREKKMIRVRKGVISVIDFDALHQEAEDRGIDGQIDLFYEYIVDREQPYTE